MSSIDALFEEFLAGWRRDESLETERLLERAGTQADELARLIDAFLERAPRRPPSVEATEAVAALTARLAHEPPLLAARISARKRVGDVAQALTAGCSLPAEAEKLVRSYYQRLEGGLLDPAGVSDRVWALLDRLIGAPARKLALDGFSGAHAAQPAAAPVFQRLATTDFLASRAPETVPAPSLPDDVRHQVERLFTGETPD